MTDQTPSNGGFDPDDPIAAAWAGQGEPDDLAHLSLDPVALADSIASAHRKDQRRLLWLNIREVVPSLILTGLFASLAPDSTHPVATFGAALMALVVGCFLAGSSIHHYRADRRWGTSVRDQLARRLAQLNHRVWMYQKSAWWYFLPLAVSCFLFLYGLGGEIGGTFETIYSLGFALFVWVAYRRARSHSRTRYESEIERLEPLLAEFDR